MIIDTIDILFLVMGLVIGILFQHFAQLSSRVADYREKHFRDIKREVFTPLLESSEGPDEFLLDDLENHFPDLMKIYEDFHEANRRIQKARKKLEDSISKVLVRESSLKIKELKKGEREWDEIGEGYIDERVPFKLRDKLETITRYGGNVSENYINRKGKNTLQTGGLEGIRGPEEEINVVLEGAIKSILDNPSNEIQNKLEKLSNEKKQGERKKEKFETEVRKKMKKEHLPGNCECIPSVREVLVDSIRNL